MFEPSQGIVYQVTNHKFSLQLFETMLYRTLISFFPSNPGTSIPGTFYCIGIIVFKIFPRGAPGWLSPLDICLWLRA